MYADYPFYTTQYGGKAITEEDWPGLSNRASAYIDMATFGAAKYASGDTLVAVKMASCALAEIFQTETRIVSGGYTESGQLSSETVGSWSRTYSTQKDSGASMEVVNAQKKEALLIWLGNTGLLKVRAIPRCPCSRIR